MLQLAECPRFSFQPRAAEDLHIITLLQAEYHLVSSSALQGLVGIMLASVPSDSVAAKWINRDGKP